MQEATESQQKVKNRNNKNELTIDLKEEDALFVGEEERTGRILTVKSPNMVDFTEYVKLRNFYRVNTKDVSTRFCTAIYPYKSTLYDLIKDNPDYYGPIWIYITICFVVGFLINGIANFEPNHLHSKPLPIQVGSLIGVILLLAFYIFLTPYLLLFLCYFYRISMNISMNVLLCLFGYSLSPFFIGTILCIVPNQTFHLVILLVSTFLSILCLISSLSDRIQKSSPFSYILIIMILTLIPVCLGYSLFNLME